MSSSRRVLFVCQDGAAKSVIAAAYFNRPRDAIVARVPTLLATLPAGAPA